MSQSQATISNTVKPFLKNNGNEILKVQGIGPLVCICHNQDATPATLSVHRLDSAGVKQLAEVSSTGTAVAAEATGFTGNGATLAFSGQVLNNLPLTPNSVVLTPATSGPVLTDGGDGKFYSNDTGLEAGTIDYFVGTMVLAYPTGEAPDGAISADYNHEDAEMGAYGRKVYNFSSMNPRETFVISGACDTSAPSSRVQVEVVVGGDASIVGGL